MKQVLSGEALAEILAIAEHFQIEGTITEILPWGNGLINDTFRVNADAGRDYLLQRLNSRNYKDIEGIIGNIFLVTETIRKQKFYLRNGKLKQDMHLIPLKDGGLYVPEADGSGWRMYNFLKDAYCMETADEPFEMYKAGILLGQFHYLLRDFPVEKLRVTVPHFHDPEYHYRKLLEAARNNIAGRRQEVSRELAFFEEHADIYSYFSDRIRSGKLPIRVTHNDPKINNIMFDVENREPICMVDLDTLMPGVILSDFGDAIRSTMCTGKDRGDETDFDAIGCDMEMYESYYKGFLEGTQGILTPEELRDLPKGAKMIAYENGMRYLTDYLNGDVYFKVKYENQNLIKTKMHIRLAEDMERKL